MSEPRVLIVSRWEEVIAIARLPQALSSAGISVGALCTNESFLAKTRYLDRHYPCPRRQDQFLGAFIAAVREWRPDLIIPGNDWDRQFLQRLLSSAILRASEFFSPGLMRVLKRSLGDPAFQHVLDSKRALQRFAADLGVPTPDDRPIAALGDALGYAEERGYPVVLKQDFNSGGTGVWICNDRDDLIRSYPDDARDACSPGRRSARAEARRILNYLAFAPITRSGRQLSIQRYIEGRSFIYNFVALDGELLAGVTVEAVCKHPVPTGPCSVVRPVRHEKIPQYARLLVRELGFSGFGCFDFIVDADTDHALFIECNPIPTNVAHLGHVLGCDLGLALRTGLSEETVTTTSGSVVPETVALFPQELRRDMRSTNVSRYHHDLPQDDPALLAAYSDHFHIPRTLVANSVR